MNIKLTFRKLLDHKSAATAIEYALIASFISLIIITALYFVGDEMAFMYSSIASGVGGAVSL